MLECAKVEHQPTLLGLGPPANQIRAVESATQVILYILEYLPIVAYPK